MTPVPDLPLTRDALVARFHTYGAPRERWRIGGEFERILLRHDGRAVGYDDPDGIRWVLEQLAQRFGWTPVLEGRNTIALQRAQASTTLEPGGQVELSGTPFASLHQLAEEALSSLGELRALLQGHDIALVALGLTPYTPIDEIPWVPKGRYRVMRRYLGAIGPLAHTMMKGTSSFQANFDYSDEADCAAKVGAMSLLGPITTAIFANSPLEAGRKTGWLSTRGHAWTQTDPARTGFPGPLREGYTHARWVDALLDVPMMFYRRGDAWAEANGVTFRAWMERGLDGVLPSWADWELHQTSVFPEVRVKRTIEIRGADACPTHLAISGIAMWTGLMYDDVALDEATALAREFAGGADPASHQLIACRSGLQGEVAGRTFADWARDLVAIAGRGLARSRPCERALLEPVEALVAHGESPGVAVQRIFDECSDARTFLRRVLY
ncbi:MAG: glutamate--cysteine ligase [Alphaproteobacteria bacterium]|nr:glutamate--cysteine ligase [Alphaproteobacteria bacterium]